MQIDIKRRAHHIFIFLGFAVLAYLYSYPQLSGKKMRQDDVMSWKGMAKEGMDYHDKTGEMVLWSNSMFGGMPTYTYYISKTNNFVSRLQPFFVDLMGRPAVFLFIAMVCFYLLMRVLKIERWLSITGCIAYAFSTYNLEIIGVGHETKMLTMAYMPAMLAGLLLIYQTKWWHGVPLLGISLLFMLCNAHYQVMFYAMIIALFAVVGMFIVAVKERQLKNFFISSALAALAAGLAIGACATNIWPTLEYNKETMRGGNSELTINHDQGKTSGGLDKEYAFRFSSGIGESLCILIPDLYGSSASEVVSRSSNTAEALESAGVRDDYIDNILSRLPLYWGPQPFQFMAGPVYFGAVICFLFLLGMMLIRSPHKWWMLAVCILSVVMAWGNHFAAFNYFLFDHVPMLNKFRVPSMILVIAEMIFPVVAVWGLNEVVTGKVTDDELWKKVKIAAGITVGLCLLVGVGGSMFLSFKNEAADAYLQEQFSQMGAGMGEKIVNAIHADRAAMASKSGLTSAVFILLAGALLWAYSKKKIKAQWLIGGICLLVATDLISTGRRYLNDSNFTEAGEEATVNPRPVDMEIMKDPDPYYRVLDLSRDPYNDAMQAYFHKCVGGYSPAKMERYQDLIDIHMNGKFNTQVLNMLNTKYIIYNRDGKDVVFPNTGACGNAWFVDEVKWAATADEEILSLKAKILGDTAEPANAFDPKHTAVMRGNFKNELGNYNFGKDSAAYVKLAKYGLNELSFTSSNAKDGLAVFADMYYPYGWTAYVDGKETPIMKADYVLRAIKIPAGQHKIEFNFHPKSFYVSDNIALASTLLLLIVCVGSVWRFMREEGESMKKKA